MFSEPATTNWLVEISGSTAATPARPAIAWASAIVSVFADPAAPRVKPVVVAPG